MGEVYPGVWQLDMPILLPETPVVHLFTDAVTTASLGWGAWWGTAWAWDAWDPDFMQSSTMSIDFLKLYAVVVAVWIWSPQFANKHVVVHSDNQPTVAVVNSKTSKSSSMLVLLRFLTLHCMLNNITITSNFLPGSANQIANILSHLQFSRFHQLMPQANGTPYFPISTLRAHIQELTALAHKESTYKLYSRA